MEERKHWEACINTPRVDCTAVAALPPVSISLSLFFSPWHDDNMISCMHLIHGHACTCACTCKLLYVPIHMYVHDSMVMHVHVQYQDLNLGVEWGRGHEMHGRMHPSRFCKIMFIIHVHVHVLASTCASVPPVLMVVYSKLVLWLGWSDGLLILLLITYI